MWHVLLLPLLLPFLLLLTTINGHPYFPQKLPNGDRVSHPCFPNYLWKGVGHKNLAGSGELNAFGQDFRAAGFKWTKELCQKDSDGDGKSNGQELGDPNCVWTEGGVPERNINITHPGICDPIQSTLCKTQNDALYGASLCTKPTFNCPYLNSSDASQSFIDLRLNYTHVPVKTTTYICQAFDVRTNATQHLIATEPLIDNANVMHHILVFGCKIKPSERLFTIPQECGMISLACSDIIGIWTIGVYGECFNNQTGMSIGGASNYQYILLQLHWNNPELSNNYWDSSGLRLHFTTNLRQHELGVSMIGQRYLEIPSGQNLYRQNMTCPSYCTARMFQFDLKITNTFLHMHYNGHAGSIEVWNNGKKKEEYLPYSQISYDDPRVIEFNPPNTLQPGDEIRVVCDFRTIGGAHTLYFGESTGSEMCVAFIHYYPKLPYNTDCFAYGPVNTCEVWLGKPLVDGCNVPLFMGNLSAIIQETWTNCDVALNVCLPGCKTYVNNLLNSNPCFNGWAWKFLQLVSYTDVENDAGKGITLLRLLILPCQNELATEARLNVTFNQNDNNQGNSFTTNGSALSLLIAGAVASFVLLLVIAGFGLYRSLASISNLSSNSHKYKSDGKPTNSTSEESNSDVSHRA